MVDRSLFGFSISFFGAALFCLCLSFFIRIYSSFLSPNSAAAHIVVVGFSASCRCAGTACRLCIYCICVAITALLLCSCSTVFHELAFLAPAPQLQLYACVLV